MDYKIIEANRADALFTWLKANKYSYSGDEATLNYYVQKKWVFTVMKIDTMQMKKNKDGSYAGEVTPTRFQFASDKLVYPLKITQISVKDKTEALFYVQARNKVDLPGDLSYQYQWVPMLQAASGCTPGGLPGNGGNWLKAIAQQIPQILKAARNSTLLSLPVGVRNPISRAASLPPWNWPAKSRTPTSRSCAAKCLIARRCPMSMRVSRRRMSTIPNARTRSSRSSRLGSSRPGRNGPSATSSGMRP